MTERMCITLRPERIQFSGNCIKILDSRNGKYKIPYQRIVLAVMSVPDRESGIYYEPEIADITRDMEGDIILYDAENRRWRIVMDMAENTAGDVMVDLAVHAPYILMGGQEWLNVDSEEEFIEAVRMTDVMRHADKAGGV